MVNKVAVVVGLEGGDALVHGLGTGGGVGWQEDELDGLEGAVDAGIGYAVVQDEGHLPLLFGEDLVLIEEVARHPGLFVGLKLHYQLMDHDHLLAEGVQVTAVVDDQLQLVGARSSSLKTIDWLGCSL